MEIAAEKGRMLGASCPWVHFVLRNTDIMTAVNKAPLMLSAVDDRHFSGRIFGVRVSIEVLGDKEAKPSGEIDVVAEVHMPLNLGTTHTVAHYRYRLVDENTTAVDLRFNLSTNGIIMYLYASFLKRRIDSYIDRIMSDNENAAIMLQTSDPSLSHVLCQDQLERIARYRAIYGDTLSRTEAEEKAEEPPVLTTDKRMWDQELSELTKLYQSFRGRTNELETELVRIRDTRDAVATLLIARRMLELIVANLCRAGLDRPRGTEPLASVIDKLARAECAPEYIITSMNNLNRLAVYGTHPKKFSPRQVREALMALCSIMEWYVTSAQHPEELAEATAEERAIIQYRSLVEGVFVDGGIDKDERVFLDRKMKELGIAPAVAARIESEVRQAAEAASDDMTE